MRWCFHELLRRRGAEDADVDVAEDVCHGGWWLNQRAPGIDLLVGDAVQVPRAHGAPGATDGAHGRGGRRQAAGLQARPRPRQQLVVSTRAEVALGRTRSTLREPVLTPHPALCPSRTSASLHFISLLFTHDLAG